MNIGPPPVGSTRTSKAAKAPDRVDLLQRAIERIAATSGEDRRCAVEREARALAYGAAKEFDRALKRVEDTLIVAAMQHANQDVRLGDVIWLVRRSMLMGLAEADAELDPNWGVIHWQG